MVSPVCQYDLLSSSDYYSKSANISRSPLAVALPVSKGEIQSGLLVGSAVRSVAPQSIDRALEVLVCASESFFHIDTDTNQDGDSVSS